MRIGIPRELKPLEGRVGLIPAACGELVRQGHEVFVETGAGAGSGYHDSQYQAAGVRVLESADALFDAAEMIVKVKEPIAPDLDRLRKDHLLFCYLHLAAEPKLSERLQQIGLTAVAFETVEDRRGRLPLLAPMSSIAGRIAIQVGAHLLHQPQGGKGVLLGGIAATPRGRVVVIGCGVAGGNSAQLAAAMGAEVVVFDKDPDKLEWARSFGANVTALYPSTDDVSAQLERADIVVGAVLIPGARAPHVVSRDMVGRMQPGSVIVDISVDQGGCVETTRPTTYDDPTYQCEGVTHFTVTNMPGAVPRTASQALSAAIAPYVGRLAAGNWRDFPPLAKGVNVEDGALVHPALGSP